MMDFLELAKTRYSERSVDSTRPIEEEKLAKILEAGRIAPTAVNFQPQHVYVLKSEEAVKKAAGLTRIYNAPLVLLVCYDKNIAWKNTRDKYYECFNSGEQDGTNVAASMMYEAADLGVHSVWIRGFDSKAVIESFNLPESIVPVMMLALGYPSSDSKPAPLHTDKRDLSETVTEL